MKVKKYLILLISFNASFAYSIVDHTYQSSVVIDKSFGGVTKKYVDAEGNITVVAVGNIFYTRGRGKRATEKELKNHEKKSRKEIETDIKKFVKNTAPENMIYEGENGVIAKVFTQDGALTIVNINGYGTETFIKEQAYQIIKSLNKEEIQAIRSASPENLIYVDKNNNYVLKVIGQDGAIQMQVQGKENFIELGKSIAHTALVAEQETQTNNIGKKKTKAKRTNKSKDKCKKFFSY